METCELCEQPVIINKNTVYIEDVWDDTGQNKLPICRHCYEQLEESRKKGQNA